MITLYTFGPAFGLPDASPFVTKAEVLLKLSGRPYRTDTSGFRKAPKGKLPYIDDSGTIVADSTFIRLHLEKTYGIDFDGGLSRAERAIALAFEKLCEDHLYWAAMHARWIDDANFAAGPRHFFRGAPAPLRPVIERIVRRQVRRNLWSHGLGRHSPADIALLANRDIDALSDQLGDKPYLMGAAPCGADATAFAFVAGTLCTTFATPIRTHAESKANLVAYCSRMMQQFFPAFAASAA